MHIHTCCYPLNKGVQWLSGKVLDLRMKGHWFDTSGTLHSVFEQDTSNFQQTILVKYHALFVIFEKAAKF